MSQRWTWSQEVHPTLTSLLAEATANQWCDRLESAASSATAGKVLCVCAALAIAREVLDSSPAPAATVEALEVLSRWIDDPTPERFDRIFGIIFPAGEAPILDAHGVVWWVLRTATSSVGNHEAGWALGAVRDRAIGAGVGPEQIRRVVELELLGRRA